MSHFLAPFLLVTLVLAGIIIGNERFGLLRASDRFASTAARIGSYVWLAAFLLILTFLVVASSLAPVTPAQLQHTPFYSLFALHAILIVFLTGWWLLTGRPPLRDFFNFGRQRTGEAVLTGFAVGFGGWIVTLAVALLIGGILVSTGLMPKSPAPSPMVAFMAGMALWKKALIILAAMTIEEAFFRGWLQKRVGVLLSTLLFALAHAGLGQPFLMIGVAVISLIIGATFYRTKDLLPGIVAHGVFDAVQLFVIIPIAFKATGVGS